MGSQVTSIRADVFVRLVSMGIFTDAEIVEWLRSNRPRGGQKPQVQEAIVKLKGGVVTGVIRTALRELEGLPPVPGDGV